MSRTARAGKERLATTHPSLGASVAKKKPEGKTKQLNVRVPIDLADRLEDAARLLATDASHLLRLILVENLPAYEDRGRKARRSDSAD